MSSELSLYFAGIFFSFLLQTSVAYLACSLLARLLSRPRLRFFAWMTFLGGSALYWAGLAAWNLRAVENHGVAAGSLGPGSVSSLPSILLVPLAWGRWIVLSSKLLAGGYIGILFVMLAVVLWRHLQLRLLLRHARPASETLLRLFETTRRELGVARCELLVLPGLSSPATVGWWRPRILLPEICEELGPGPRLAGVLYHELAHVATGDFFWTALSDLVCRILFFHPAAWRATKQARLQCELACDLAVMEARPEDRADYADSLAYFVRLRVLEERAAMGVDFAGSASSLGKRIRFILAGPQSLPWWKRASRALGCVAVMSGFAAAAPALTVLLAFAHPLPETSPEMRADARQAQHQARKRIHRQRHPAQQGQDLARISARRPVRETSVYSLTKADSRSSEVSGEMNGPWQESGSTERPSVVQVVRSAVGIAVATGDHDRDRKTTH